MDLVGTDTHTIDVLSWIDCYCPTTSVLKALLITIGQYQQLFNNHASLLFKIISLDNSELHYWQSQEFRGMIHVNYTASNLRKI